MGATVYGVSRDSVAKQAKFHKQEKLNFPLLSDPDGSVVAKFGNAYANRPFAKRWTFVLDNKGVVRHIFKKVKVRSHGEELLTVLGKLKSAQSGDK